MTDDEIRIPTGSPGDIYQVALALGTVGDDAEDLRQRINGLDSQTGPTVWRGQAADAFRELLAELGPELARLATAHHTAREVLHTYASALSEARGTAFRAQAEAERARSDREAARQARARAGAEASDHRSRAEEAEERTRQAETLRSSSADPAYQSYLDSYQSDTAQLASAARAGEAEAARQESEAGAAFATADATVTAKRALAAQAQEMKEKAARKAAHDLDQAGRPALKHRNFLQRAWGEIDDTLRDWTASPAWQRWSKAFSSAGSWLVSASEVAAFIPFIGPEVAGGLLLAGLAYKGLALGMTAVSAAYGRASWGQVAVGAMDVGISAVGGRGVIAAARAGKLTEEATNVVRVLPMRGARHQMVLSADEAASEAYRVPGLLTKAGVSPEKYFRGVVATQFVAKVGELGNNTVSLVKDLSHGDAEGDGGAEQAADAGGQAMEKGVEKASAHNIGAGSRSGLAGLVAGEVTKKGMEMAGKQ